MSNSPIVSTSYRPERRSTRLNEAIPMRVEGVDSYRGPYSEEVSTVSVSAHGCKYFSKHQVLSNALVILELKAPEPDAKPVSARGRVKWVAGLQGGLFETAVELEDPGNVWGIASPPKDWLPFCGPKTIEIDTAKSKPFAVPRPEPVPPSVTSAREGARSSTEMRSAAPASSQNEARQSIPNAGRPVGALMGDFQQQMESMLSEVAAAAVREKTGAILNDVQAKLRQEAKGILAEVSATQAAPWIEQAVAKMKTAGQETAQKLHAQWTKTIETNLATAMQKMEVRRQEVEELSRSLAANSLQKVEAVLESSRRDGVDRIVTRLKEQVTPIVEEARKAASDLTNCKKEMDGVVNQSVETARRKLDELAAQFDKQFETMLRTRIEAARQEMERAGMAATDLALNNLRISSEQHQERAQAKLREQLSNVSESVLKDVGEKAAEVSQQFSGEMKKQSRGHLEYVSGAISELAKGIGKLSREG